MPSLGRAEGIDLCGQCMTVEWIAAEPLGPHHQTLLVRHRQAHLDADSYRYFALPLAVALDLGRVRRVQLALVLAVLRAYPLGALHQRVQRIHRQRAGGAIERTSLQLALHLAHQFAQNRVAA